MILVLIWAPFFDNHLISSAPQAAVSLSFALCLYSAVNFTFFESLSQKLKVHKQFSPYKKHGSNLNCLCSQATKEMPG